MHRINRSKRFRTTELTLFPTSRSVRATSREGGEKKPECDDVRCIFIPLCVATDVYHNRNKHVHRAHTRVLVKNTIKIFIVFRSGPLAAAGHTAHAPDGNVYNTGRRRRRGGRVS